MRLIPVQLMPIVACTHCLDAEFLNLDDGFGTVAFKHQMCVLYGKLNLRGELIQIYFTDADWVLRFGENVRVYSHHIILCWALGTSMTGQKPRGMHLQ